MRSVIYQSVLLPAPAETLFATYIDPQQHAAMTGAPVTIGAEPGSPFSAFGGALAGTILQVVPARLIVQSWRSSNFLAGDPDSTLIINFMPEAEGGRIDLVHLDVPEQDFKGVTDGWESYYWEPWRRYLVD